MRIYTRKCSIRIKKDEMKYYTNQKANSAANLFAIHFSHFHAVSETESNKIQKEWSFFLLLTWSTSVICHMTTVDSFDFFTPCAQNVAAEARKTMLFTSGSQALIPSFALWPTEASWSKTGSIFCCVTFSPSQSDPHSAAQTLVLAWGRGWCEWGDESAFFRDSVNLKWS